MTRDPVATIWAIYGILTLASLAAFGAAGMPAWKAVNHAPTGISAGCFAVTPDSFHGYDEPIPWTAVAVMVAGALSFAAHLAWLTVRPLGRGERRQVLWFAGCLAVTVDAVAALSSAGLTGGFVGPDLPSATFVLFSPLMWLGRIEVLAALVLVLPLVPHGRPGPAGPGAGDR